MISKELTAASSNLLVLGLLNEAPSYGYAIQKDIKTRSDGLLDWAEGHLYPVLHRLEKNTYIEAYWGVAENGRKRKYYRILPTGKQYLQQGVVHFAKLNALVGQFKETL